MKKVKRIKTYRDTRSNIRKILLSILLLCIFSSILWIDLELYKNIYEQQNAKDVSTVVDVPVNFDEDTYVVNKYSSETLQARIEDYLQSHQINTDRLGIAVYNFEEQTEYTWQDDLEFIAGSTYKLPLAMLYYDMIDSKELSLDSVIPYTSYMGDESSGIISSQYPVGSEVPLSELLYELIVHSDNSAGYILYEELGGWQSFKDLCLKYTNKSMDDEFSEENVMTPGYLEDVLKYLYTHKEKYTDLIENMAASQPNQYLDYVIQVGMPQKYGSYDIHLCAGGFVEENVSPYCICIFTTGLGGAEQIMGDLNEICYNYFKI